MSCDIYCNGRVINGEHLVIERDGRRSRSEGFTYRLPTLLYATGAELKAAAKVPLDTELQDLTTVARVVNSERLALRNMQVLIPVQQLEPKC